MVLLKEIPAILEPIIKELKKTPFRLFQSGESKPVLPEYYPEYATFISWRKAIAIHTVKGEVPKEMLSRTAPCQSDDERDYILDNYKQITLPVSYEFLNTIGRGMHDQNWSITYQEDVPLYVNAELTLQTYLEIDIAATPLQMSFEAWWKSVLPSIKINDSMGVVAVKPWRAEATVEMDGENVIAGDRLPEPIPYYYPCDAVLSGLEDRYFLIDTGRKSVVEYSGKKQSIGLVLELYDEKGIYTISQTGKQIDWEFKDITYYEHELGFTPATRLMGSPCYLSGRMAWQSPFLLVTDILDEAIIDSGMLRSTKASSTFPQKVMVGNECQFQENHNGVYASCQNGYILNENNDGYHQCSDCKGSGMKQRTGPLKTILVKAKNEEAGQSGDGIKPSEALAYVSPSTETPAFLREEITNYFNQAKEILHLKTTNSVVKGAEDMTATGMAMDEKGKYAFMKPIVDQIFDIGEFLIACMGGMRYRTQFKKPSVQRPVTYDFSSEADHLQQMTMIEQAGGLPVVKQSAAEKYLRAVKYDDQKTGRIYDLIIASDRLLTMSQEVIANKLSRNLVFAWEVVLHDSAFNFIQELIAEDESFLEKDMDEMKQLLIERAKSMTPPTASVKPLSVESILTKANGAA